MKTVLITIMAFYTLAIVVGLHVYEEKLKNKDKAYSDLEKKLAKEALPVYSLAVEQSSKIRELDILNKALQSQVGTLKSENTRLRNGIVTGYPEATL